MLWQWTVPQIEWRAMVLSSGLMTSDDFRPSEYKEEEPTGTDLVVQRSLHRHKQAGNTSYCSFPEFSFKTIPQAKQFCPVLNWVGLRVTISVRFYRLYVSQLGFTLTCPVTTIQGTYTQLKHVQFLLCSHWRDVSLFPLSSNIHQNRKWAKMCQ